MIEHNYNFEFRLKELRSDFFVFYKDYLFNIIMLHSSHFQLVPGT